MAKYIVTETVTRTIEVDAPDAEAAEEIGAGAPRCDWSADSNDVQLHVERIHVEFEYRGYTEQDDYSSEDDWESAEDKAFFREHGAHVCIIERRALDTEAGEPGEWEIVDSMGGCMGDRDYLVETLNEMADALGVELTGGRWVD